MIKPKSIHNQDILDTYDKEYLYLSCVKFVKQVRLCFSSTLCNTHITSIRQLSNKYDPGLSSTIYNTHRVSMPSILRLLNPRAHYDSGEEGSLVRDVANAERHQRRCDLG